MQKYTQKVIDFFSFFLFTNYILCEKYGIIFHIKEMSFNQAKWRKNQILSLINLSLIDPFIVQILSSFVNS